MDKRLTYLELPASDTRRAALEGRPAGPLPVPALESLRQVFHGPDSPPEVPMDPFGELALLPDRPSQAEPRGSKTPGRDCSTVRGESESH